MTNDFDDDTGFGNLASVTTITLLFLIVQGRSIRTGIQTCKLECV